VFDVAAAAVTLVHEAAESTMPAAEIAGAPAPDRARTRDGGGELAGDRHRDRPGHRGGDRERPHGAKKPTRTAEHVGPMAVLFIGAGKAAGIRPGDLVGAITGEADIPSHLLGAITIAETHALVEVPAALADSIVAALRATKIRGQRVTVRRDRG